MAKNGFFPLKVNQVDLLSSNLLGGNLMSVRVSMVMGSAKVEVEAPDAKEAVKELSSYIDFFGESTCGLCQSTDVVPRHRVAQGYDFYEMVCRACGAKLSFGQTREDNKLFPKRKDNQGNWMDNKGWHKFERQQSQQSQPDPNEGWI